MSILISLLMTGIAIFNVAQDVRARMGAAYWEDATVLQDDFDMTLGYALPPAAVSIEKRLMTCELWATHLTESLEHGVLHAFYCDGMLTELEATDYMETGKYRARFYYRSGRLIYARDVKVRYELPDGTLEAMLPGKYVSVQARELFQDGSATGQMDTSLSLNQLQAGYAALLSWPARFAKMSFRNGAWTIDSPQV